MSTLLHLGKSTTSGDPGVECVQPSTDVTGRLCLSFSCISSSSSVQVSGRTCHGLFQTFDSSGTMLDEGSLASCSLQHVGKHLIMEVSVGQVLRVCHICI